MPAIDPLEALKNGLPATGSPPRHIVVIGAGMAGLTSGLLLQEAGHRVTILEAQNRLGGRVYTYRGFPGKMYGEFGAMRFPRQHRLAQHLIQERFKLETWPFSMDDEDTFIFFNGTSLRRSEFHPDKLNLALPAHEQGQLPDELLRRALRPLTELIAQADGWERLLAEYDGYSLIDFLRQSDISDTALAMIGPLLNLEGRFHFSLVEWFSHYYDNVFGDLVYLVDGADALPNAFAPGLMPDIKLGAEVHAIFQGTEGVTVHYKDPTGYSQSVTADECILTVPFILLRHLEIRGLDVSKWYARVWCFPRLGSGPVRRWYRAIVPPSRNERPRLRQHRPAGGPDLVRQRRL